MAAHCSLDTNYQLIITVLMKTANDGPQIGLDVSTILPSSTLMPDSGVMAKTLTQDIIVSCPGAFCAIMIIQWYPYTFPECAPEK